jgi:transcriptional regulator with XRE-family HTH domain
MAYGTNIKHLLRERRMTIRELSEKSGVSLNTLYNITKRDSVFIRKGTIEKVAPVLGVTPKELSEYDIVRLGLEDGTTSDDTKKMMMDQVQRIMSGLDNVGCAEIFRLAVQIDASGERDAKLVYMTDDERENDKPKARKKKGRGK